MAGVAGVAGHIHAARCSRASRARLNVEYLGPTTSSLGAWITNWLFNHTACASMTDRMDPQTGNVDALIE